MHIIFLLTQNSNFRNYCTDLEQKEATTDDITRSILYLSMYLSIYGSTAFS
jgi:hypothetical protein